jgi:hypothetical protein
MKPVLSKTFTTELVLERSSTSWQEPLGTHESTMELYIYRDGFKGMIEWDIPALERTEQIGLWFETGEGGKKELSDYDGVMCLPEEAIALLEEYGIVVGEDYR